MIFDDLIRKFEQDERRITHLLAARGGEIVAEWYRPRRSRTSPHMLHSATKSFVGTAIGLAIDEGMLALDARLVSFLTEAQRQSALPGFEKITIADMLTMRTGHATGTSGVVWRNLTTSWIDAYLEVPLAGPPGEAFMYSSGTSHLLSVCLQKATGVPVDEYLRTRIFEPLGFGAFTWDKDPEGYCSGGNGLSINILDFLKWGQLYLNRGTWEGQQLVPADWVDASLTRHVNVGSLVWTGDGFASGVSDDPEAGDGYGYQLWNRPGGAFADGIFGQYCVIVPEADTVLAVFSSMTSKQAGPFAGAAIDAALSSQFASFIPPFAEALVGASATEFAGGSAADSAPSNEQVVGGILSGDFVSSDGATHLTISVETGGGGAVDAMGGAGPVDATGGGGAFVRVRGHDAAGAVAINAGIGGDVEFETALSAPSLHHSYTEVTRAVGHVEWRGPWSLEIVVDYPITPFTDTFSFQLASDGILRYARDVNVNSQGTGLPGVLLRRIEE